MPKWGSLCNTHTRTTCTHKHTCSHTHTHKHARSHTHHQAVSPLFVVGLQAMYKHVNGLSELMVAYVPALKPQAPHAISTLGCQPAIYCICSKVQTFTPESFFACSQNQLASTAPLTSQASLLSTASVQGSNLFPPSLSFACPQNQLTSTAPLTSQTSLLSTACV